MTTTDIIANIKDRLRELGVNQKDVLERGQLTRLVGGWKDGNSPRLASIDRIASALLCTPEHLLRPRATFLEPPAENVRRSLGLLENTGTGIEAAAILLQEYNGILTDDLVDKMGAIGLCEQMQLYHPEDGEFRYGQIGGAWRHTLGRWAIEAPGRICGRDDPDPELSEWCKEIYRPIMAGAGPARMALYASSRYHGDEPRGYEWEALYWKIQLRGNAPWQSRQALLMVGKTTMGLI